jgi:hypothetical protein
MAKNTPHKSRKKTKPNVPALRGSSYTRWTLTGVSPKTRTAVQKAAHKEGLSIGAWVDKTLHAAATETLKGGSPLLTLPPDLLAAVADISRKLDGIEHRLEEKSSLLPPGDIDQITDDFRKRAGQLLNQLQSSTSKATDLVVEHTQSTMSNIRELGGTTIQRIKEVADAARGSAHDKTETKSDKSTDETSRKS